MTTEERLTLIAEAAPLFAPFTGEFDLALLHQWREQEFGSRRVLTPKTIVHIISGNTPHAAYQSLLRGLVVGSKNLLKLPSQGLPDFEKTLPASLSELIETSRTLPNHWILEAGALVVYGSDPTISHFREMAPLEIPFLGHGHRVGVAMIDDPSKEAARLASRDIGLFDQHGCLSLQTIYLKDPAAFGPLLAEAMMEFEKKHPRGPLTLSEHGAITNLRIETRYLEAQEPENYSMWCGDTWTIISDHSPGLALSPGNRTVYLKPLSTFRHEPFLSGIGLYPYTERNDLPSPRIFPLGEAQNPPFLWHHDGVPPLASLVKFQDR